jgi:hypothetical protein
MAVFSNALLSLDQLKIVQSDEDGVPTDLKIKMRIFGCNIIKLAGKLLQVPQVCIATAQVLFHSFFAQHSFKEYGVFDTAMGAVLLAAKLEESPRRCRQVIHVFHAIKFIHRPDVPFFFDYSSIIYTDYRERITNSEMLILRSLGFRMEIMHPYGLIVNYLKCLDLTSNASICQAAWNYLNDR